MSMRDFIAPILSALRMVRVPTQSECFDVYFFWWNNLKYFGVFERDFCRNFELTTLPIWFCEKQKSWNEASSILSATTSSSCTFNRNSTRTFHNDFTVIFGVQTVTKLFFCFILFLLNRVLIIIQAVFCKKKTVCLSSRKKSTFKDFTERTLLASRSKEISVLTGCC